MQSPSQPLERDSGDFAAVALLNFSSAFDTVEHDTLIRRLHVSYGLRGLALNWFRSHLQGRVQHVRFAVYRRDNSTDSKQSSMPRLVSSSRDVDATDATVSLRC